LLLTLHGFDSFSANLCHLNGRRVGTQALKQSALLTGSVPRTQNGRHAAIEKVVAIPLPARDLDVVFSLRRGFFMSNRRSPLSSTPCRKESTSLPSDPLRNSCGIYQDLNLAVETISIDRIKPNLGNPRKHAAAQIHQIASSIEAFGIVLPFLITPDEVLITGHAVL
jgi:hypothetical protein